MNSDLQYLENSPASIDEAELRKLGLLAAPTDATSPREVRNAEAVEFVPLQKLPPSPTRSLGGYFDYGEWPDCERFIELDIALLHRSRTTRLVSQARANAPGSHCRRPAPRCTAKRADGSRCEHRVEPTAEYTGGRCAHHRYLYSNHETEEVNSSCDTAFAGRCGPAVNAAPRL